MMKRYKMVDPSSLRDKSLIGEELIDPSGKVYTNGLDVVTVRSTDGSTHRVYFKKLEEVDVQVILTPTGYIAVYETFSDFVNLKDMNRIVRSEHTEEIYNHWVNIKKGSFNEI